MSKTNEKTAQQTQAAARADGVALVPAAPASQAATDAFHGRGGLYTVVDGARKRVGGTEQPVNKDHAA